MSCLLHFQICDCLLRFRDFPFLTMISSGCRLCHKRNDTQMQGVVMLGSYLEGAAVVVLVFPAAPPFP